MQMLSSCPMRNLSSLQILTFNHEPCEESKTSPFEFSVQLKKLYHNIYALKTKILADSGEPQDESRIVIKGSPSIRTEEAELVQSKEVTEGSQVRSWPFSTLHGLTKCLRPFQLRADTLPPGDLARDLNGTRHSV
jgi:hypothetical protein